MLFLENSSQSSEYHRSRRRQSNVRHARLTLHFRPAALYFDLVTNWPLAQVSIRHQTPGVTATTAYGLVSLAGCLLLFAVGTKNLSSPTCMTPPSHLRSAVCQFVALSCLLIFSTARAQEAVKILFICVPIGSAALGGGIRRGHCKPAGRHRSLRYRDSNCVRE